MNDLFWQGAGGASAFNTTFDDMTSKLKNKIIKDIIKWNY